MSQEENFNRKGANDFLKNISFLLLGLVISYIFVNHRFTTQKPTTKFDDLLKIIQNNYVDSIDITTIEDNAVTKLLKNLDPHSVYITSEELAGANEVLEGNFSGVGIEFFIVNDTLSVVAPIQGGPSELAGIKSGDKVLKINDTIVAGTKISNIDVYKKLRGVKGSKVKLTLIRNGDLLPPIVLKRDIIKVNSVEPPLLLDSNIGYIKINSFGENTYMEFYKALENLVIDYKIKGLVLDLRQNTGGYLEVAVAILDELIVDKKLLVFTEGLHYPKEQFFSKKVGLFEKGKITVLIDEGSASASEIVAGAIQDLDRGIVVGRRSFGKGLVQNQILLSDGSAVRLTIAKYFTPSGRNIQKPYSKGLDYESELYSRYKNGELYQEENQKINDTTAFFTAKGRVVKGGGGIYPDIFVPLDTNYDMLNFSLLRSEVPEYVYSNYSKYKTIVSQYQSLSEFSNTFEINNKELKEFYSYLKKSNVKWNPAKKSTYESKLKLSIKAFIAKQFYGTKGYIKIMNQNDKNIIQAKKSIQSQL